jgi:hypothetical protein
MTTIPRGHGRGVLVLTCLPLKTRGKNTWKSHFFFFLQNTLSQFEPF